MKTEIRTNDTRQFKTCRRAWFLTSHQRMNLERKRPVHYFFLGRGVHYALDALYSTGEDPVEAFTRWYTSELDLVRAQTGGLYDDEEEMYSDMLDLGCGMLDHYVMWAKQVDTGLEVVATETEFETPLITPGGRASPKYAFAGRLDGIVRDVRTGELWVMEYKTTTSQGLANVERRLHNDEQGTAYIYALSRMFPDEKVGGALFTYLKKKLPTAPRLIHGGTAISRAKNMDTTFEMYVDAIKEHDFDYQDYVDILRHLKDKGNTFFARFVVKRHPGQLANFERDLHTAARDMSRVKTIKDAYPNPPWYGCMRCTVREICDLVNLGAGYEFLVDTEYRPRRKWSQKLQKEEETI